MSGIVMMPPMQASLVLGGFDIMKTKTCGEGEKNCRREENSKEKYWIKESKDEKGNADKVSVLGAFENQ